MNWSAVFLDAVTTSDSTAAVTASVADDDDDDDDDESVRGGQNVTTICTSLSQTHCHMPVTAKRLHISVPIYGYVSPPVILLTLLTNSLICVVLLRRGMRTATNLLLAAMALSDMLTGLCPLPCFVYFYSFKANGDWVPYSWCAAYAILTDRLPTVFHTASIWLTVALAIHRYICVCKPQVTVSRFILTVKLLYKCPRCCLSGAQRFGVGLVIERSLVRLPAGALSSLLGQLSLPSLRGR